VKGVRPKDTSECQDSKDFDEYHQEYSSDGYNIIKCRTWSAQKNQQAPVGAYQTLTLYCNFEIQICDHGIPKAEKL
jgi:hypothetical protein